MRMIISGRLLEDQLTLSESSVPKYDWPTPVLISVKPAFIGEGGGAGGRGAGAAKRPAGELAGRRCEVDWQGSQGREGWMAPCSLTLLLSFLHLSCLLLLLMCRCSWVSRSLQQQQQCTWHNWNSWPTRRLLLHRNVKEGWEE